MLERIIPTYGQGFARNAAESLYPELWRGLVGLWSPVLGPTGGPGRVLYDWSGYNNTGYLVNIEPADWITSERGYVLDLDGNNERVSVGSSDLLDITNNLTVAMWARLTRNTTREHLMSRVFYNAPDDNGGYSIRYRGDLANDPLRWVIFNDGAVNAEYQNPPLNTWLHIVGVKRGANSELYVNGILRDTQGGASINTNPGVTCTFGSGGASYFLDGQIGEASIYNRALTANEIAAMYAGASPLALKPWVVDEVAPNHYPNRVYPETPDFPTGHEDVPIGPDLYTVVAAYIEDMTTDAAQLFDQAGNIELGATEGIKWDSDVRIDLSGGEIKVEALQVNTELIIYTPTLTTLNITGDLAIGNDLIVDGNLAVTGAVTSDYVDRNIFNLTQADEPGDPADNNAVFWNSTGVGYGDIGDLCCKITEGGGTTDFTISDFSAL